MVFVHARHTSTSGTCPHFIEQLERPCFTIAQEQPMRLLRIRLDTICVVVLLAALNLGWYIEYVRHGLNYPSVFGFSDRGFDASVLPMLTALVIGLYHIIFHRGRSTFLLGFVITGLVATLAFMLWVWIAPQSVTDTLMIRPFPKLVWAYRQKRISIELFGLVCSIIDSSLQLFIALLGGWLAKWWAASRKKLRFAPSEPF
jgi:hypothetical protein